MPTIVTLLLYYWLITFSIVGYGILFHKFFVKNNNIEIGYIGIYGIFFFKCNFIFNLFYHSAWENL